MESSDAWWKYIITVVPQSFNFVENVFFLDSDKIQFMYLLRNMFLTITTNKAYPQAKFCVKSLKAWKTVPQRLNLLSLWGSLCWTTWCCLWQRGRRYSKFILQRLCICKSCRYEASRLCYILWKFVRDFSRTAFLLSFNF